MNLLALLLAKAGAATATAKVAVAGAVSVAAIGTAGATGVVPVEALLPGTTSVTVQEDADPGAPVEEITPAPDEIEAPEEDETPEEEAPEEDAGKSAALEALAATQSRAPEEADAGLDRARAAVSRARRCRSTSSPWTPARRSSRRA